MKKSKNLLIMNKKNPKISIIIRTKNEEKYLSQVLQKISKQTVSNFEVIIVDDNSTDKTLQIAEKFGCRIIGVPVGKFSHPYSCNLGASRARGKYLVFLNGHSIPVSNYFLEKGLKNFQDKKVAGVYCYPIPHKDATLTDRILHLAGYLIGRKKFIANKKQSGLLGTTNAMIRKDLWQRYNFPNINDGWGGEDTIWARYYIEKGYNIVHDPGLQVRHSHHLKLKDFWWQIANWKKMAKKKKGKPVKQRRRF